jgi:hypothetical protein
VREFECVALSDGCAAFSQTIHDAALEGLRPVAAIQTIARTMTMMVLSAARIKAQSASDEDCDEC